MDDRSDTFARLVAAWRREGLGIRTVLVTLNDAVRTTRTDGRSSPDDRHQRVQKMRDWAVEVLGRHRAAARELGAQTTDAGRSGTLSPAELAALDELARDSSRRLSGASDELARMAATDTATSDGVTSLGATSDGVAADAQHARQRS